MVQRPHPKCRMMLDVLAPAVGRVLMICRTQLAEQEEFLH